MTTENEGTHLPPETNNPHQEETLAPELNVITSPSRLAGKKDWMKLSAWTIFTVIFIFAFSSVFGGAYQSLDSTTLHRNINTVEGCMTEEYKVPNAYLEANPSDTLARYRAENPKVKPYVVLHCRPMLEPPVER